MTTGVLSLLPKKVRFWVSRSLVQNGEIEVLGSSWEGHPLFSIECSGCVEKTLRAQIRDS